MHTPNRNCQAHAFSFALKNNLMVETSDPNITHPAINEKNHTLQFLYKYNRKVSQTGQLNLHEILAYPVLPLLSLRQRKTFNDVLLQHQLTLFNIL